MSNDEILTVKETAALLKTTRQQVRKMIANEELPAFWSVGCLTHKSESFRLRFVLFAAVCSADFPLFPSSPARFFRILGQKWVKEDFPQVVGYNILSTYLSLLIKQNVFDKQ